MTFDFEPHLMVIMDKEGVAHISIHGEGGEVIESLCLEIGQDWTWTPIHPVRIGWMGGIYINNVYFAHIEKGEITFHVQWYDGDGNHGGQRSIKKADYGTFWTNKTSKEIDEDGNLI